MSDISYKPDDSKQTLDKSGGLGQLETGQRTAGSLKSILEGKINI